MSEIQQQAEAQTQAHPTAVLDDYRGAIASVAPPGTNIDLFIRMTKSNVNRSDEIVAAVKRNPGLFMQAVMDSAALGHIPGSEYYYLTPRRDGISGIESWKGVAKRIFNTGRYQRIVCEVVYEGEQWEFQPGEDLKPKHVIDWDARQVGSKVRFTYAYAVDFEGNPSTVAVCTKLDLDKAQKQSRGKVWDQWYEQMAKKTAIKRLEDFVDTSAVDLRADGSSRRHSAEVAE
ncbi:RecT-like ssDNA annealing protein [Gordonia phage Yvonnetastic]|uniref:RecT-like DNA pairing protein n=1 Tax=Gordonia phage Yvonnetastic TaxID=1821566 RepID=A0A142K967_9CAUD|nr:RecT-like ssDNA annealing protein [Gordonia phage Yvonnetastic]AMS02650.1 RecT-like DNA pairing protein [Gordonia phage Yvonnetastic]